MNDEQKASKENGRIYRIVDGEFELLLQVNKIKPAKTLKEELERVPEGSRDLAISYLLGLAAGAGINIGEAKEGEQ